MIQFRRGSTASWKKLKTPLAAGQPGYDKDKHKIKVGDGKNLWDKLPYASITEEEVLDSEINAKLRIREDPESLAIITYGKSSPDKNTVGKLYLQQYETEPEADYIIETGINSGWLYRKWKSGVATCSKVHSVTTSIQTAIDSSKLYQNSTDIGAISYPFTFKSTPTETATIQSPSGMVWLAASKRTNTTSRSAKYNIISADRLTNSATYKISISVEGFWK